MTSRSELVTRVAGFVSGGRAESFEDLAAAVHEWQVARCPVARALVGTEPGIPAVPVALFKQVDVGAVRGDDPLAVVFRTSGTTRTGRGVHRMVDVQLYDLGALRWGLVCLGALPGEIVALLEDPVTAPDSSLSHMVAAFRSIAGAGVTTWHVAGGELDVEGLRRRVDSLQGPAFVAATAFALAYWLRGGAVPLPPGSTLMVTGGFKGRVLDVDGDALLDEAARRLGCRVVTEYGMTELSSQLWGTPGSPYRPPPWMRVTAVDPVSGAVLPPGHAGQLRFLDLCNLDAAVHVETLDQGVVQGDGSVTLHGRLPGAEVRGCSIPLEAVLLR